MEQRPIFQNFENITQSGTEQMINAQVDEIGMTSAQYYSFLGATTLIIVLFLSFIYILSKTYINKSCAGCKRLKNCEKEIKEIKKQIEFNKNFDFDVFKNISDKLDDIQEDLQNG